MSALETWAEELRSWAIPQPILDAAPESPFGFPVELFRHRAEAAARREPSPTPRRVAEALPLGGTILDVGAGGGAASLPLAHQASMITAVDPSPDLLRAFLHGAAIGGCQGRAIEGSWPEMAPEADEADVVVCANVAYNVADLAPFVAALDAKARHRVVLELTDRHPLAWMNDLWLHFHDVVRPAGPTADIAVRALAELGFHVDRQDHYEPSHGAFEHREEAVAFVRRRLCLPPAADEQVAVMLGDRLRQHDALWSAGPPETALATLWWDTGAREDPRASRRGSGRGERT